MWSWKCDTDSSSLGLVLGEALLWEMFGNYSTVWAGALQRQAVMGSLWFSCPCPQGTVFVWVFWPSFNSLLAASKEQAVLNTYFALAVSAVAAFMLSALTSRDGKFRMVRMRENPAWGSSVKRDFLLP